MFVSFDRVLNVKTLLFDLLYDLVFVDFMLSFRSFCNKINFSHAAFATIQTHCMHLCIIIFGCFDWIPFGRNK